MTGKFTEFDPERCEHYARFFAHLTVTEANLIFWLLFLLVLTLMCIASFQHHKSNNLTDIEKGLAKSENTIRHRRRVRRQRIHYLSIASLCFVLGIVAIVFEVYAALSIQFCDGEDLIALYWAFWSVLQVGSIVAILGVMLQFWIVLGNVGTPSWAVALGTPVLVFAAIGWIFRHLTKKGRERWRKSQMSDGEETDVGSEEGDEDENEKSYFERWMTWRLPAQSSLSRVNIETTITTDTLSKPSGAVEEDFARSPTLYDMSSTESGYPLGLRRSSTT